MRWRWLIALAAVAVLVLPAGAAAESEFANPGRIEGVVTKTGGARVQGVEVCAFDVAEDEEFTECAATRSNGTYLIQGLDEGPYRVEFKSGSSGLDLATQWWKGATTASAATIVRAEESLATTGIDAEMKLAPEPMGPGSPDACPQSAAFRTACPTVSFAPGYSVGERSIQVGVRSSATTPVTVTGASPGPGFLKAAEKVSRGTLTTLQLPIPPALGARLGRLDPSRSIHLRLRAHATAVEGLPSTDHLWISLPGRG